MLKFFVSSAMVFYYFQGALATASLKPWINGGEKVTVDDPIAKSTVMLETDAQYCSATIIAEGALLTAAHCLKEGERWIKIHFSGLEGTQSRLTSRFVRHEKYRDLNESTRNDLALVFFEGGLPEGFQKALILSADERVQVGEELQLAGYGGGSPLGTLAKVKLSVSQISENINHIQFNQNRKYGICHGDSGGPAFKSIDGEIFLTALASYTHEFDCSGYSVYTLVTPYLEWIQQQVLLF